jgi:glycogen debranching enzyme
MIATRETCADYKRSSKLEWLETNGSGGFAMGTVAGINTRRYHGILVASLRPPVERYVMLSRLEEEAHIGDRAYSFSGCQYPGTLVLEGLEFLEEFRTDPCATWRYNLAGAIFEKQIYLIDGRQAAVARYRTDRMMTLRVRPFFAARDYHSLGRARDDLWGGLPHVELQHDGRFEPGANWYYNIEYSAELERGLDFREDLFTPGVIELVLRPGEWSPMCASIDGAAYAAPKPRANPFVVRRADGRPTIIAGYPWFTDWGRDTMISLPGLLIASGRLDEAREVIESFLAHLNQGLIPNRFPDSGETPEYNTADATLWMFPAMRAWLEAGGDRAFLRDTFYPAAREIIEWHRRGTFHDIGVDPRDHLLRTGGPGTQLTWMDAKVGDWVVTPRHGKPVEINALWHNALCQMAEWDDRDGYRAEAEMVRESFRAAFWHSARNCLFDVVQDAAPVAKLRPNQLFAVSLGRDLLDRVRQQAVVRAVEKELLTPVGLRTLDRADPDYKGRYEGPPAQRDGAYHQGTVWPWLLGPFVDAYLIAFGDSDEARAYCRSLADRLQAEAARAGCADSIAEIYDGDEPRLPRGCPAQAWSVAELGRIRKRLSGVREQPSSGRKTV